MKKKIFRKKVKLVYWTVPYRSLRILELLPEALFYVNVFFLPSSRTNIEGDGRQKAFNQALNTF